MGNHGKITYKLSKVGQISSKLRFEQLKHELTNITNQLSSCIDLISAS